VANGDLVGFGVKQSATPDARVENQETTQQSAVPVLRQVVTEPELRAMMHVAEKLALALDAVSRMRINVETGTLTSIATVNALTTVTTVSNLAAIGGISGFFQQFNVGQDAYQAQRTRLA
jgi:hypothetical protein